MEISLIAIFYVINNSQTDALITNKHHTYTNFTHCDPKHLSHWTSHQGCVLVGHCLSSTCLGHMDKCPC